MLREEREVLMSLLEELEIKGFYSLEEKINSSNHKKEQKIKKAESELQDIFGVYSSAVQNALEVLEEQIDFKEFLEFDNRKIKNILNDYLLEKIEDEIVWEEFEGFFELDDVIALILEQKEYSDYEDEDYLDILTQYFNEDYRRRIPVIDLLEDKYLPLIKSCANHHAREGKQIGFNVKMKGVNHPNLSDEVLEETGVELGERSREELCQQMYNDYLKKCWNNLIKTLEDKFDISADDIQQLGRRGGYVIIDYPIDTQYEVERWVESLRDLSLSLEGLEWNHINLDDLENKVSELSDIKETIKSLHKEAEQDFPEFVEKNLKHY